MAKISFKLSEIDRAIRELEQYRKELRYKVSKLVEVLTDSGVEIAKMQVRQLGAWYTGELESSITGYFSPSAQVGIIKAGSPHAMFVEFGTGIVGAGSPHPAPMGWVYDTNAHGESGWWYFNENDNSLHWTKGFISRPFMYNTALELEKECKRIAREVFNRG